MEDKTITEMLEQLSRIAAVVEKYFQANEIPDGLLKKRLLIPKKVPKEETLPEASPSEKISTTQPLTEQLLYLKLFFDLELNGTQAIILVDRITPENETYLKGSINDASIVKNLFSGTLKQTLKTDSSTFPEKLQSIKLHELYLFTLTAPTDRRIKESIKKRAKHNVINTYEQMIEIYLEKYIRNIQELATLIPALTTDTTEAAKKDEASTDKSKYNITPELKEQILSFFDNWETLDDLIKIAQAQIAEDEAKAKLQAQEQRGALLNSLLEQQTKLDEKLKNARTLEDEHDVSSAVASAETIPEWLTHGLCCSIFRQQEKEPGWPPESFQITISLRGIIEEGEENKQLEFKFSSTSNITNNYSVAIIYEDGSSKSTAYTSAKLQKIAKIQEELAKVNARIKKLLPSTPETESSLEEDEGVPEEKTPSETESDTSRSTTPILNNGKQPPTDPSVTQNEFQ